MADVFGAGRCPVTATPAVRGNAESQVGDVTRDGTEPGAVLCHFKADNGYRSVCGAPAIYMVWGDPCACTHVYDCLECAGHPVCVEHGSRLRIADVRIHREREQTFKLTRICDLPAPEPRVLTDSVRGA